MRRRRRGAATGVSNVADFPLAGGEQTLASARSMTRFLAVAASVLAIALAACERHPIAGQSQVTHTHGSSGSEGHGGHAEVKGGEEHHAEAAKPAEAHGEKKSEPAAAKPGEAPKFFPEKK